MEKRSESDIVLKVLKLTFGGKEYEIPVLRMAASAKWRAEFFERTAEVTTSLPTQFDETKGDISKALGRGMFAALLQFPEKIPELVFSYAPSLPKEEILEAAYDQEFSIAFRQIWRVAFEPFLASLGMVTEMHRTRPSASVLPTN